MMMRSVKRWVAIGLTAAVAAVGQKPHSGERIGDEQGNSKEEEQSAEQYGGNIRPQHRLALPL